MIRMKLLIVFAFSILVVNAADDYQKWIQFKKTHNKIYNNIKEDKTRFEIFQDNLRTIEEHNVRYREGEETYYMAINKFADLTKKELLKFLTFKEPSITYTDKFQKSLSFNAPESCDWRDEGVVLPVKDQADCGSCWAFSATGAIESQNAIKHNLKIQLSEQELVACSYTYGNNGCDGGEIENAYTYVADHGIATEEDYPYDTTQGRCKNISTRADVNVTGFVWVDETEDALRDAVAAVGPISVAINADLLFFYSGGIFELTTCPSGLDHAVLAVGYGTEDIHEYWIIKNSWGKDWGEDGYFKMTRNESMCGIGSWNSFPVVD